MLGVIISRDGLVWVFGTQAGVLRYNMYVCIHNIELAPTPAVIGGFIGETHLREVEITIGLEPPWASLGGSPFRLFTMNPTPLALVEEFLWADVGSLRIVGWRVLRLSWPDAGGLVSCVEGGLKRVRRECSRP